MFEPLGSTVVRPTLATAAMPRRVRRVLEHLYALVSDEMARQLERMLGEFEQQLFRQADHARNPAQQSLHFETLRIVRLNRADLVPHYLMGLEAALTRVREPLSMPEQYDSRTLPTFRDLRLVEDSELDEGAVLRGIAARHSSRANLGLHLLGQRFGVLGGAPAFDADRLPVGPYSLCRILGEAGQTLQIGLEPRLLLFRTFDRHVLNGYAQLVDTMNALLARENVLPSLAFVPIRTRPTTQAQLEAARHRREERPELPADAPAGPARIGPRPHTAWQGQSDRVSESDEAAAVALLQQLLSGRRDLLGKLRSGRRAENPKAIPTAEVIATLGTFQGDAANSGVSSARNLSDLRQALLTQSHKKHGEEAALSREDSDTFELLGMLYNAIQHELREDSTASVLLNRLQVPLLRAALLDRTFFVQQRHPARQLLNTVAESGASWMSEDESDPQLDEHLRRAVDHVVEHYHGDSTVFDAANQRLQQHLRAMARKAEVTERRHVEAARGKEKLELAKHRAAEEIDSATQGQQVPRFVRSLLSQAWADVLTLILLRHGEESSEWQQHQEMTRQIVLATLGRGGSKVPAGLGAKVEHALGLVGYHADEANAIARRLTTGVGDEDDPASRTELAMKLKARGRLGEDSGPAKPKPPPPRSAHEQQCYDQLRALPFGTWFEFVTNQQGDVVRRRLSWYSPVTDNALFVNQRGQRVGEQSLDSLARMLAAGQTRIVTADKGRLVDRAWHAALNALRSFAGLGPVEETTA
ncbi:DUF1631 domain-containing protein [Lysobacter niastensis]|nr:DUF1631 domain-containing protein [Lysobacter niastensis]